MRTLFYRSCLLCSALLVLPSCKRAEDAPHNTGSSQGSGAAQPAPNDVEDLPDDAKSLAKIVEEDMNRFWTGTSMQFPEDRTKEAINQLLEMQACKHVSNLVHTYDSFLDLAIRDEKRDPTSKNKNKVQALGILTHWINAHAEGCVG